MAIELGLPPLGLYVHLPWCVRKCPYCDFNSHTLKNALPAQDYVDALLADLESELPAIWGRTVSSVFIGGGTPSLFSAAYIEQLLDGIRARVPLAPGLEVTLEANPGTIERDSFTAYRQAGISRVSLGAQSFDSAALNRLGRIHGPDDIHTSLGSLQRAGLNNFNIDLMFGLPAQDLQGSLNDLESAMAAEPAHVSHYQLTLEPNTAFAANPPDLPDDEVRWEMTTQAATLLQTAGYEHYEVSAWSKPHLRCRHNMNYWQYGDYLGIGAGAHGKLTLPATQEIVRKAKTRHPRRYLAGSPPDEERSINPEERVFEYFLNVFRLRQGFEFEHFTQRTAVPGEAIMKRLEQAARKGLLAEVDGGFRPTELGWRFSNDLQGLFLPEKQGSKG